MRAFTALAFAAALTLSAAPATAKPFHHHHDGFWGGPGLIFGLAGAATVAADAYCVRYEPVYDDYGAYTGRRRVNEC